MHSVPHEGRPPGIRKGAGTPGRAFVNTRSRLFEADEVKDVLALLRYLAAPDSNLRAAAFLRSRFVRLSDPAPGARAQPVGRIGRRRAADPVMLDREDEIVLERARDSVRRWLGVADRCRPQNYSRWFWMNGVLFETRGPRVRQGGKTSEKSAR
jgi:hypothetical protein